MQSCFLNCLRFFRPVSSLIIVMFTTLFSFAQAPNWSWANRAGGTSTDWAATVATDAFGNTYATGHYYSGSMNFGAITVVNAGLTDIFLVKYDMNGNVIWAQSIGSTGSEWGYGLATDLSGNVYLAGIFNSPVLAVGTLNLVSAGNHDSFLAKFDGAGNVIWANHIGGSQNDFATSVSINNAGMICVAGSYASSSLLLGSFNLFNAGGTDVFVARYDTAGNVIWAKRIGDSGQEVTNSVSMDQAGNVFISGTYNSLDMIVGSTTLLNSGNCIEEIFIVKFDAAGNVAWAKSGNGFYDDYVFGIATDLAGNVYLTGHFNSPTITFGSLSLNNGPGGYSIFLIKYNSAGVPQWAISPLSGIGMGVATDVCGDIYMTGSFGTATPVNFGSTVLNPAVGMDIYVGKVSASGIPQWASRAGGTDYDAVSSITVSPLTHKVVIAGSYISPVVTFGPHSLNSVDTDGFIASLDPTCMSAPLPVSWISFTGKQQNQVNVLQWQTASESNNNYFTVERSNNANDFEAIGFVQGAGNSNSVLDYKFIDHSPHENLNYYRLKQTDFDLNSSLSEIIAIDFNPPYYFPLEIFPNPAFSTIQLTGYLPEHYNISISDPEGKLVFKCSNQRDIDISSLTSGLYFIRIESGPEVVIRKLVKE
jgi:hypothetical protein